MTDPIALGISAGVAALAAKVASSTATEAGKTVWKKIETLLGWSKSEHKADIAAEVAKVEAAKPDVAAQIQALLSSLNNSPDAVVGGDVHHNKNVQIVGKVEGDQKNSFR